MRDQSGGRGRTRGPQGASASAARRTRTRKARLQRQAALENLEARTLLATLPAPVIAVPAATLPSGGTGDTSSNESEPSIAVDRYNPQRLVAVWSRFDTDPDPDTTRLEGAFSTNGGLSWQGFGLQGPFTDPTTSSPARPFTRVQDASVAFDANGNFYVASRQANDANSAGVVVVQKFAWSLGGSPSSQGVQVLHEWNGQPTSPADNVTLAVDDGVPSYVDPDTGAVHSNPHAGSVYVAWNTGDLNLNEPDQLAPNAIYVVGSSNGGVTYTSPQRISTSGSTTSNNTVQLGHRMPRIAVSQGRPGEVGGRLSLVWDDYQGGFSTDNNVRTSVIRFDQVAGVFAEEFVGTGGAVTDNATVTTFTQTVTFDANVLADPNLVINDLDVGVRLTHAAMNTVSVVLVPPSTSGLAPITLVDRNVTGADLGGNSPFGATGHNLTVFDAQARQTIAAGPARGYYQPATAAGRNALAAFNNAIAGIAPASLQGEWRLEVTDFTAGNVGTLGSWSLLFGGGLVGSDVDNSGQTNSVQVTRSTVFGQAGSSGTVSSDATPDGITASPVIAIDNTLGSFSPFQSRIYVGFVNRERITNNPANNTDIYLAYSDDHGLTWSFPVQVNDDQARFDGFSEGHDVGNTSLTGRPQFQPSVAVDQATGSLVMSWYDTRHDAARARVATFLTASIDGGETFSEQVFANTPKTAIDAITGEVVVLEPIPDNQSPGNPNRDTTYGFGDRQGLAVHGGRVYPIWSSNLNGGTDGNARLDIRRAIATIAGGPRIIDSTMGPIGLTDQFGNPIDPINPGRTADGTPVLAGFDVVFDRPIDPATFRPEDVRVFFRDTTPTNVSGGPVPVRDVVPLASQFGDPDFFYNTSIRPGVIDQQFGYTRFRVVLAEVSAVGTYSYAINPDISDRIRAADGLGQPTRAGNLMDQNADATPGQAAQTGLGLGDVYAAPRPTTTGSGFVVHANRFFDAPYDPATLPLILPGPHVVRAQVPGTPQTADNLSLDRPVSAIDITFDRDMAISSFDGSDILRIIGPAGELIRPQPFVAPGTNRLIPDRPAAGTLPLVSTLEIPGDGTFRIADLDLRLDLTHPDLSQLTIELQGPSGPPVVLLSGLSGTGLRGTVLDDEAPTLITQGSSPYTGRFRPSVGALSAFDGRELHGTWRLIITDNATGGSGTLHGWSLEATPRPVVAPAFNATTPGGSRALNLPIGNGATLDSFLTIPASVGGFTIADLNVTLDISHLRPSDLSVSLVGPNGQVVPLFAGVGGSLARDFRNTTLDDEAGTLINQAPSTSFTGIYRPSAAALSAFDGQALAGTWTLRIVDAGGTGSPGGTLNSWSLTATPVPGSTTAVARTFRVSFPTQRAGGSYAVTIGPEILSRNGDAHDDNLNAGLDLRRGTALAAPTVGASYSSTDVPKPIPDAAVASSLLTVPDAFTIADLNVRLSINHPHVPDLTVRLIGPSGQSITLLSRVGANAGNRQNFTNTLLDDQATTMLGQGAAPFFGTFKPQQGLSTFNGLNAAGIWTLEITDEAGNAQAGTLVDWTLLFQRPVPNSGLGEPVADRATVDFRIFRMDPTDPQSGAVWTPVGPASISESGADREGYSGRVTALAVDPSDPTGNTVYIGGATGGVWKTSNFLTTDPDGPTWVPLTDFGPTHALNIGSLVVFGRNNDPNRSIIFAGTGEPDAQFRHGSTTNPNVRGSSTQGVGFLRSLDGGATWELLDSRNNSLPFDDPARDHVFANSGGTATYKIVVDPTPQPNGEVIVYAAMSGPNGGLWRSLDTGTTWTKLSVDSVHGTEATDVVLDLASKAAGSGNVDNLYAAFAGRGVYRSTSRGQSLALMSPIGVPQLRDADQGGAPAVTVGNLSVSPNSGASARIVLAKPDPVPETDPGASVRNALYQDWLYAAVVGDSTLIGLYLTKDRGQTWTDLEMNTRRIGSETRGVARPSNDPTADEYDVTSGTAFAFGPYNVSLIVDPNDPNITYLGGTSNGTNQSGLIRVDATRVQDAHALTAYVHSRPDGGQRQISTNGDGAAVAQDTSTGAIRRPRRLIPNPIFPGSFLGLDNNEYLNLIRDPDRPFDASSAVFIDNISQFTNDGTGVRWTPFDLPLYADQFSGIPSTGVHRAIALRDPLTGQARLIFGTDQGVFTGVDAGNGTLSTGIGTLASASYSRVGNLQISQIYRGAAQPSTLAAQLAGALFYGMTQGNGHPTSQPDILENGENWWSGLTAGELIGYDVATDQQGRGTVYQYKAPGFSDNANSFTEFFQVNGVPHTNGLIQTGGTRDPQWPDFGPIYEGLIPMGRFAVNPINGDQVVISSNAGRIFATTNQADTWSPIAEPGTLDGTYAPALAYGAPDPAAPGGVGNLGNFIYAGTMGGRIFVTRNGGGSWQEISDGLDGSSVVEIVTNPDRGSHEAYAVTLNGVYYTPDSLTTSWRPITGNLFSFQQPAFGDATQSTPKLTYLSALKADWRYAIPEAFGNPASPTHPVLYVAGNAGVYRSFDNGTTWTLFPTTDDGAPQDGGYLPSVPVTDLDLALGLINPTNGRPQVDANSPNVLLASTYGRGAFAIRLAPQVLPDSLRFAAGSDTGISTTDRVTSNPTPTIEGLSAQTAFGDLIRITLIDLTDPANPRIVGGYDPADSSTDVPAHYTDATGAFAIAIRPGALTTDGLKTIGVQAVDQAGTRGNIVLFEFTLDTQAPGVVGAAPDLQPTSDTPLPGQPGYQAGVTDTDNLTFDTSPTFDVATNEPATTRVELLRRRPTDPVGSYVVVATVNVNDLAPATAITDPGPLQPDGVYIYAARLIDLAGNVSQDSAETTITIDTIPPATPARPTLHPADDTGTPGDGITSNLRPRLNGQAEPNATVELLRNGIVIGTTTANATGAYTVQPDVNLPGGAVSLQVRAVDRAGNISANSPALALQILSDSVPAPSLSLVPIDDSGIRGDLVTNVVRPRFNVNVTVPAGLSRLTVQLLQIGSTGQVTVLASVPVQTSGTYVLQPTTALSPDGPFQIQARVLDDAGNGALSDQDPNTPGDQPLVVTLDTTAANLVTEVRLQPTSGTLRPDGTYQTTRRRPVFEGVISGAQPGDLPLTVQLIDAAGTVLASGPVAANRTFALSLPQDLLNGTLALWARAVDRAGNPGPRSDQDPAIGGAQPLVIRVVTAAGDFSGDGKADPAVVRPSAQPAALWSILPGGSSAGLQQVAFNGGAGSLPAGDYIPLRGDFDGDGQADIAFFRHSTATFYIQSPSGLQVHQFGPANVSVPVAADYDGDGKADIAVFDSASAFWYVRPSSNPAAAFVQQFGPGGSTPVPADYDGDGRADLAVFDSASALWYVRPSSNPAAGFAQQFGPGGSSVPIPADYDGDGKADLAVFDPRGAIWYIAQSRDGARVQQFGPADPTNPAPVSVPTPADYDGDGKADLSVFLPPQGMFLTIGSRDGVQYDPVTGSFPRPMSPAAGDLPVQAPYAFARSGGTLLIPPTTAGVRTLAVAEGDPSAAAATPTPAPAVHTTPAAPDLGRTALAFATSPTPALVAPPAEPSVLTGPVAARTRLAELRERLLQYRRARSIVRY